MPDPVEDAPRRQRQPPDAGIEPAVAVDADGKNVKVLIQNGRAGVSQFQDNVIDWTPDDPNTVLVAADDDGNTFPSVFKLNIYTGLMSVSVREREPIRKFVTDGRGRVRLGTGYEGKVVSYFAKLEDENSWTRLAKMTVFSDSALEPVAISPGRNKIFATGDWKGREALWEMDLTDRDNPVLLFQHEEVDISGPMLAKDGRMLGIYYEMDLPFAFYTDDKARAVIGAVKPLLPDGAQAQMFADLAAIALGADKAFRIRLGLLKLRDTLAEGRS